MLTAVQVLPGIYYPAYRLVIIAMTLVVALLLYLLVMRTRIGMLIRAGASNREMVGALGVNIKLLYTLVFGLGAALAGFAGLMQAPILTVQIGMGENILILAFVVIIIGGIGSIRGAFVASVFVGLVDTIGRAFLPDLLRLILSDQRRLDARPVAVLDADLHADGGDPGLPAGRSFSGVGPMTAWLTPRNAAAAGVLALLALLPVYCALTGNNFLLSLFTRIVILAIAAVSLNLIMGFGGMVSFGHAAYLGIGGYVVGILAKEGVGSGFVQWPLALAVSALFALGVGALSLRTRGVYFIMITLAFAQMIYYVAIGLDRYGGDDGLTIYQRSSFGDTIDLSNGCSSTISASGCCWASVYLVWRIVNSRFGLVIQGARSNDRRMRAIGFPTFRYRLVCFVISGALCGLAGVLLANHTDFISPAIMHWTRSGDLIVMAVLGGMGSVIGPVIGAVALLVLEEGLSRITEYWPIILGPMILLVVLYARGGIDGLLAGSAVAEPLLRVEGLTKRFGGVIASDDIMLEVAPGELHAIIGPNGAGKTTLIGQLAGELAPDAGRIWFDGRDITLLPTHGRSALGLARSFQITSLFPDFTALDNVALAVQAHAGHSFRFWRDARRDPELREPARAALARVGLAARADTLVVPAEPRRASPARARDGARHQAAPAAARRADGGAGARGIRAHGDAAARAQAGA